MKIKIKSSYKDIFWYYNHIGEYYNDDIHIYDDGEKMYKVNDINNVYHDFYIKTCDAINVSEIRLKKLNSL